MVSKLSNQEREKGGLHMEELIAQQEEYIQNLTERRSQVVFEQHPEKLLGETWWLESHFHATDDYKVKCEYPHPS